MEYYSDESQELKQFLLDDKLKYLLNNYFICISVFPAHWKVGNKAGLSSLVVQDIDAIKFRKVKNFLFDFRIKKSPMEAF